MGKLGNELFPVAVDIAKQGVRILRHGMAFSVGRLLMTSTAWTRSFDAFKWLAMNLFGSFRYDSNRMKN